MVMYNVIFLLTLFLMKIKKFAKDKLLTLLT